MSAAVEPLPVQRAGLLQAPQATQPWLVRPLWGHAAVGLLGGPPKCCKSWLGLELATCVASGKPVLGRFPVEHRGPALIYMAEDALHMVRARLQALCDHHGIDMQELDLHVICSPSLRLDLKTDQQRLAQTITSLRPRLLLLDPLVRLHRLDENSASDISALLSFLRQLQRQFDLAVIVVHHAGKRRRAHPGAALRGSGDLWAFGDSNAYLARIDDHLLLTLEHRAAPAPDPIHLHLVSQQDGSQTHLDVQPGHPTAPDWTASLPSLVLSLLKDVERPLTRTEIRARLRVNNARLGQALSELEQRGEINRTKSGWVVAANRTRSAPSSSLQQP